MAIKSFNSFLFLPFPRLYRHFLKFLHEKYSSVVTMWFPTVHIYFYVMTLTVLDMRDSLKMRICELRVLIFHYNFDRVRVVIDGIEHLV